jgi:prolyl oligopeptidase
MAKIGTMPGRKGTKKNTTTDFLACAQYLIDHGYTSAHHLAGEGTSAGGITIGGAITERPDLFASALDNVGMSDDLRAELQINGPANIPEFGTVKNEAEFHDLLNISAYHRLKDRTVYPAVLLSTGFNDPRVDPWQMNKMTARLQAATSSGRPVLLRVDYDSGHRRHAQAAHGLAHGSVFIFIVAIRRPGVSGKSLRRSTAVLTG